MVHGVSWHYRGLATLSHCGTSPLSYLALPWHSSPPPSSVLTDAAATVLALAVLLALNDVTLASLLPQVNALPALVFAI